MDLSPFPAIIGRYVINERIVAHLNALCVRAHRSCEHAHAVIIMRVVPGDDARPRHAYPFRTGSDSKSSTSSKSLLYHRRVLYELDVERWMLYCANVYRAQIKNNKK